MPMRQHAFLGSSGDKIPGDATGVPAVASPSSSATTSPNRPDVTLSLTGALLATTSWTSAIQLLMFASMRKVKIHPETLLVAHHRIYNQIPERPCVLAVALLSHLHQASSLPYRMTRTACAEAARKPPVLLYLEQLSAGCQRGHWMDNLRLMHRCASPSLSPVLRSILSPGAIPRQAQSQPTHVELNRMSVWLGLRVVLERMLAAWCTSSSNASRPFHATKELLWHAAHLGATSELRHSDVAILVFRLLREAVLDQLHCDLGACSELISTVMRAMQRLHAVGLPNSAATAMYRAAAQRAAHRAVQLTASIPELVCVLQVLMQSDFRIWADEEIILEAFKKHSGLNFNVVSFARDPAQCYVSDHTLRVCAASCRNAVRSPGRDEMKGGACATLDNVGMVCAQWAYRVATTSLAIDLPAKGVLPHDDAPTFLDLAHVLPTSLDRALFLARIAARHCGGSCPSLHCAAVQFVSRYGADLVRSLRILVGDQNLHAGIPDALLRLPNPLFDACCESFISLLEDSTVANPCKAIVLRWIAMLNVTRGVGAAYLLRMLPRGIDVLRAHEAQDENLRTSVKDDSEVCRALVVNMLESCVQGPAPGTSVGTAEVQMYQVLTPMALHLLMSVARLSWSDAIRRLHAVAAPWFREQHYFSLLSIAPRLIMEPHAPKGSWRAALVAIEASVGARGRALCMPMASAQHREEVERIVDAAIQFWTFQSLMSLLSMGAQCSATAVAAPGPPLHVQCDIAREAVQHALCDEDSCCVVVTHLRRIQKDVESRGEKGGSLWSAWSAACRELVHRFPAKEKSFASNADGGVLPEEENERLRAKGASLAL